MLAAREWGSEWTNKGRNQGVTLTEPHTQSIINVSQPASATLRCVHFIPSNQPEVYELPTHHISFIRLGTEQHHGDGGKWWGVMYHRAMRLARAKALKRLPAIWGRTDGSADEEIQLVAGKQSHTLAISAPILIWTWVVGLQEPRVSYSTSKLLSKI